MNQEKKRRKEEKEDKKTEGEQLETSASGNDKKRQTKERESESTLQVTGQETKRWDGFLLDIPFDFCFLSTSVATTTQLLAC